MSAIVTDGEERIGLTVARSLWMKGVNASVSSKTRLAAAFYSRYCKSKFVYPDPSKSIKTFINFMLRQVIKERPDVLMPISDYTTPTLSYYRKKFLPYTQIPLVDHDKITLTYDKKQTFLFSKNNGIPIPNTYFPKNVSELEKLIKKIEFPVVVKPNRTKIWVKDKIISQQVAFAKSPEELIFKYKSLYQPKEPPTIQEYIPGDGYGFFGLFNNSKPRCYFMHKRIREFPVGKGASTLRVSVYNPKIKKYGMKLLKALNWHGVAMVEFRIDERDKLPKLMEVNGRFWGSLPLAISSGVDFPFLLYKMAVDGDVKKIRHYKTGIKSRWIVGDIYHLISVMTGSYDRDIIKDVSRFDTLVKFFNFFEKNTYYDMFYPDDLLPGFINLLYSINRGLEHIVGR